MTCYSGYGLAVQPSGDKPQLKRHLVCLDRGSGEITWQADLAASGNEHAYEGYLRLHGYASHTPVADASGVYVFYGASGAAGYRHDGKPKWRADCGSKNHEWGSGTSPLLFKQLVIVAARVESKSIIAFDKETGREVWRRHASFGHGTPAIVSVGDSQELVFASDKSLIGADPATGKRLWNCRTGIFGPIAMPLAHDGIVYLMTRGKSLAVRAGGRGDVSNTHVLWRSPRGSHVATPVYHNGHLYFPHDELGVVYCLNAETGKRIFEHRLPCSPRYIYASPIIADRKLYYVTQSHGSFVLPAEPDYKLLAHNVVAGDKSRFNATPAVSRGQLLLRSDKYLYCIGEQQ